jgi:hypothetical protein
MGAEALFDQGCHGNIIWHFAGSLKLKFSDLTGVLLSNTFDPVLTFVETTTFTGQIVDLVSDDDYAAFQTQLSLVPDKGSLLVGCGGVRKIRMAARGKGKSGGARVLYLYLPNRHLIYFLYLFTKGDAGNISAEGKKAVRQIAEQIKMEHRR